MPERGAWAMASESTLPGTLPVVMTVVTFNSRMTAKLAQSVNDKTGALRTRSTTSGRVDRRRFALIGTFMPGL
jgi:hypothetical protein